MAQKAKVAGRTVKLATLGVCLAAGAVACMAGWRWASAPRVWRTAEVPIAFWAWRTAAPIDAEIETVRRETGARTLFMRAGQFDYANGRIARIRAVEGELPRAIELQLVYNATPALLAAFDRVDEEALAEAAAATFIRDAAAGARIGARVAGLQLDFDVPTRLLPRYGRVLTAVRRQLPVGAQLSVTGLPTWMNWSELGRALAAADFWVPQFYGAELPRRLTETTPISAEQLMRRDVARARALGKPFYAGLAAYGYAGLYSERGELRVLRGDLDPEEAARHAGLELVERRAFALSESDRTNRDVRIASAAGIVPDAGGRATTGGWKYVFRAREAAVVGGTSIEAGESLVFYLTSGEGLRSALRIVREKAGEPLLGVCIFRLPLEADRTTLGLAQVAAALADRAAKVSTKLRVAPSGPEGFETPNQLKLTATNDGAVNGRMGAGAVTVTLRLRPGSLRGLSSLEGFDAIETLCELGAAAARPCSPRRAGLVRLSARSWPAGASARVGLSFEGEPPTIVESHLLLRTEDGRTLVRAAQLQTQASEQVGRKGVEQLPRVENAAAINAAGASEP